MNDWGLFWLGSGIALAGFFIAVGFENASNSLVRAVMYYADKKFGGKS